MKLLCLVFALAAALPAQQITITSGAAPYQVFQRDKDNVASMRIEGSAANAAGKAIEARLMRAGSPLPVRDWTSAGKVTGAAFTAAIDKVPTGGPYRLDLRVAGAAEVTSIDNLLVGDLYILAGQSNMEGVGNLQHTPLPSALVNSFDMTDSWTIAADPLHRLVDAKDSFHWIRHPEKKNEPLAGEALQKWIANRKKGAGVGLPFALEMVRRTGVPVGLVPCAHGGTSMAQWSPELKDKGGASLYGGMVRRFKAVGGKAAGLLWYQGESDASPNAAPLFEQKWREFIQSVRADFAQPDLPVYYVQIGRHVSDAAFEHWNSVQDSQRLVEAQLDKLYMTTCIDCELDDAIHVGTDDYRKLAVRMANLAEGKLKRGPRPVTARLEGTTIKVDFAYVNERLTHSGRLNGFVIVDAANKPLPLIYRQRISASDPNVVELLIGGKVPDGAMLRYGMTRDPYANLVDAAGMPAPVFGPFPIQR